jgi:hypothetical protein
LQFIAFVSSSWSWNKLSKEPVETTHCNLCLV